MGNLQEQHPEASDSDDVMVKNARQLLTEVKMLELRTE
jgi:hypothetical protein